MSLLVRCHVAFALLHIDTIALWQLVAHPLGDVLGCRVARKHFVEVDVVKLRCDAPGDFLIVNNHSVGVQLLGFAVNCDDPIVTMQLAAFAGIGQLEAMAGRDDQTFAYVIHLSLCFSDKKFRRKGTKKNGKSKRE